MTRRTWLLLAALAAAVPAHDAAGQASFFDSHEAIEATLRTDLGALRNDRDTATARWHEATLSWRGPDGPRTVPLRVRTRGIYRLANCLFPPIRLRFAESDVPGTPWEGLRRPKLVTHCVDRAAYEQNLLQEYAIYRVLRLVTPLSYSVRLLRMTYEDAGGVGRPLTRYAFVIEEPDRFAARLGATPLAERDVRLTDLVPSEVGLLGFFQYFIANTDWSVPSLHNIELFSLRDTIRAVPYDFDWSGVVAAPYARPAPILPIGSVRERLYRGPCLSRAVLEPVLARFESLRDTIAALYRSIPGLEAREADQALRYFDEFYRAIRDRAGFMREVVERDCLRSRFGNPPPGR